VIYKCDQSYFKWCTKRFPNQLLPTEVETIKHEFLYSKQINLSSKITKVLNEIIPIL